MHARVTTLDMDPSKVDEVRDRLEGEDVPEFQKLASSSSHTGTAWKKGSALALSQSTIAFRLPPGVDRDVAPTRL
jgi:hypothetical protein